MLQGIPKDPVLKYGALHTNLLPERNRHPMIIGNKLVVNHPLSEDIF